MQLTCPTCEARYLVDASLWPISPQNGDGETLLPRKVRCKSCQHVWMAVPQKSQPDLSHLRPSQRRKHLRKMRASEKTELVDNPAAASTRAAPTADQTLAYDLTEDDNTPEARPSWFGRIAASLALVATLGVGAVLYDRETGALGIAPYADPYLQQAKVIAAGLPNPLSAIDLPDVQLPQLPQFKAPELQLPREALPPLTIQADAVKRKLSDQRQIWEISGTISNPTQTAQNVPLVEVQLLDKSEQIVRRWTIRPDARSLSPAEKALVQTSVFDPPEQAEHLRLQLKPAELGRL